MSSKWQYWDASRPPKGTSKRGRGEEKGKTVFFSLTWNIYYPLTQTQLAIQMFKRTLKKPQFSRRWRQDPRSCGQKSQSSLTWLQITAFPTKAECASLLEKTSRVDQKAKGLFVFDAELRHVKGGGLAVSSLLKNSKTSATFTEVSGNHRERASIHVSSATLFTKENRATGIFKQAAAFQTSHESRRGECLAFKEREWNRSKQNMCCCFYLRGWDVTHSNEMVWSASNCVSTEVLSFPVTLQMRDNLCAPSGCFRAFTSVV